MIQIVTPQLPEHPRLPAVEQPPTPAIRVAPPFRRKKVPAYGKPLLLNRMGGFHPARVRFVFGDDWRLAVDTKKLETAAAAIGMSPYSPEWRDRCGWPVLAMRPVEFEREAFDLRLVVNTVVDLFDQTDSAGVENSPVLWLAGELSRWAADVLVDSAGGVNSADTLAFVHRRCVDKKMIWPEWWSDELEEINEQRSEQWYSRVATL